MNLPAALSRRDVLLFLIASAMGQSPSPEAAQAQNPAALSDEFVIVDGWVLPVDLLGHP